MNDLRDLLVWCAGCGGHSRVYRQDGKALCCGCQTVLCDPFPTIDHIQSVCRYPSRPGQVVIANPDDPRRGRVG